MKKVFMIIAMALFTVGAMANTNPELEKSVEQSSSIMDAMSDANVNSAVYSTAVAYGGCTFMLGTTIYSYTWNGDGTARGSSYDLSTGSSSSWSTTPFAAASVCNAAQK